jgi:hypothetical protein
MNARGIMSRARNSASARASSLSVFLVDSAITRILAGFASTTSAAVGSRSSTNQ